MFLVLNKDKINSYLISLGTVVFLFAMAFFIKDKTYETSIAVNEIQEIKVNEMKSENSLNETEVVNKIQ